MLTFLQNIHRLPLIPFFSVDLATDVPFETLFVEGLNMNPLELVTCM